MKVQLFCVLAVAYAFNGTLAAVQVPPPIVYFSFDGHLQNEGIAVPDEGRIEIRDSRPITYSPGLKGLALDTTANPMGSAGSYVEVGIAGSTETPIEQALNAGLKSFTICGWLYTTNSWAPSVSLVDREQPGAQYHYQIRIRCNDIYGQHRLYVNDQLTSYNPSEMGNWADQNRWLFFAVTYDSTETSNQVKFYKGYDDYEGHVWLDAQTNLNAGVVQPSDKAMWLAATTTYGSASYEGLRDEFRIFASADGQDGALTLEQLQETQARDLGKPFCGDQDHPYPEGDLNYDCVVDFLDFAEFADAWLGDVY